MSFSSDHQQPKERKPKQLLYMEGSGMSSNTIAQQDSHTSESHQPTSTNLTEKVSPQNMNQSQNHQMKNPQHHIQSQKVPVMRNLFNALHLQLSRQLHHQQHQEPPIHTMEQTPQSYHQQTHTTLALLLFTRNNNCPQQIWRL
jgi:hypothetical protein